MAANCFENIAKSLSLLLSFSMLFCCVLPILFSLLGFGATFAALIAIFPFLVTLSKIKAWLFLFGFILLSVDAYYVFFRKKIVCPIPLNNDQLTKTSFCDSAAKLNRVLFWFSALIFSVAFFTAYLAFPLLKYLGML